MGRLSRRHGEEPVLRAVQTVDCRGHSWRICAGTETRTPASWSDPPPHGSGGPLRRVRDLEEHHRPWPNRAAPTRRSRPRRRRRATRGYDASAITVLEGLEAVRKRPGMYIGSTGPRGLHHLVYEIVDNSVDEALAGYCDHDRGHAARRRRRARSSTTVAASRSTSHPTEGKSDRRGRADDPARRRQVRRRRLRGLGRSARRRHLGRERAVARASTSRSAAQGYVWRQTLRRRRHARRHRSRKGEATDETGHHASPSGRTPTIFETVEFDFETLRSALPADGVPQQGPAASRSPTSARRTRHDDEVTDTESAEDERQPRDVSYRYERRPRRLRRVPQLGRRRSSSSTDEIIDFEAEDTERKHLRSRSPCSGPPRYTETVHTYANTINTHEGGTHEEGFRAALTTLVNRYAREKSILKEKDDNLTGDDVREGLTAVISVKLGEPQFEGQTKTKLGNTEAKTFVQKVVGEQLGDWFDRNPGAGARTSSARRSRPRPRAWPPARRARPTRRKGLLESRRHARQAQGLPVERSRRVARSSSSRATRPAAPPCAGRNPRHAGDPAAPRQDPQRREGAARPGAGQPRGPGDDHGVRHRHRRGLRRRQGCGTTRSC